MLFVYRCNCKSSAEKFEAPEYVKLRIIELVLILRENPVPGEYYDVKKLKGLKDTYRIRLGDLRIIY